METQETHSSSPIRQTTILVFSPKVTNRLRYILEEILERMLGLQLEITGDQAHFRDYEGAKLNYSSRRFDKELFFYASPLLFERRVKPQRIKMDLYKEVPTFFISKSNSDLPYDLFAASFYLLSRYEEYYDVPKDKHNRYPAEASIAYKHGFLDQPIIDKWVQQLKEVLLTYHPTLLIREKKFRFVPTYDIDIAYAYRNKGLLRTLGAYLLSLKRMDWATIKSRTNVLIGREKDPYDTYDWLLALQKQYKLSPIYFFLVGEYGTFDKNISVYDNDYQDLIQSISDVAEVGIHPSYGSNQDVVILEEEIRNLSSILKKEIRRSRQHYLKLEIPTTYENLMELDVYRDYSMGYASQTGFRAGTTSSFFFYDLSLEIKTKLRVFPFAAMDVTLRDYLNLNIEKTYEQLHHLMQEAYQVNGLFITLFHNHSFSNIEGWDGWREMYEELVKEAAQLMASVETKKTNA